MTIILDVYFFCAGLRRELNAITKRLRKDSVNKIADGWRLPELCETCVVPWCELGCEWWLLWSSASHLRDREVNGDMETRHLRIDRMHIKLSIIHPWISFFPLDWESYRYHSVRDTFPSHWFYDIFTAVLLGEYFWNIQWHPHNQFFNLASKLLKCASYSTDFM